MLSLLFAVTLLMAPLARIQAAEWGDWHDYLAQEMTPGFARDQLPAPRTQIRHSNFSTQASLALSPDFAVDLLAERSSASTVLTLSYEQQSNNTAAGVLSERNDIGNGSLLRERSLKREYLTPGVVRKLTDDTFINVSLVLASQQYGAANLGYVTADAFASGGDTSPFATVNELSSFRPYQETVHGTGVRFGIETRVLPWLGFSADYQSRIDMEDFSSFLGVYADPADLDVPARFGFGLNLDLFERFRLTAETERVMYHNINAFPSSLLPQRFLSLLGDSTSPEFAWSNLTVYRFGWDWQVDEAWRLNFSYATRSQPLPTADVLADALRGDLARNSFTLGITSQLGRNTDLTLNTAYAPAEYAFGGNVLGIVTSDLDQSLEMEMLLRMHF